MKRLVLFLTLLLFAAIQLLQAQAVEITGTVTSSEDGSPVPGASIIVKGTTVGTVSSSEGTFVLRVPADATELVVSFVGLKTQDVRIEGRTTIDIIMEPDILGLDEVVVTALGITREKKALGYSVQDVSGESIGQSKETNIVNTLQGKVAGVQITNADGGVAAGSRIIIRGLSGLTVGDNNQPLWVVDGVPIHNNYSQPTQYGGMDYGNAAMDLNPADIESISVLKGANAAALYGSRAVNGVVLVTTKSGASRSQRGIGVTFESNWMWDNVLVMPKYQNKYGQ
ncbi:MAG: SusC/RagA family TonB-linked outer membrane protein, partial [Bacteroides sp. SM23_62_1]